jgi:hypothetical protein
LGAYARGIHLGLLIVCASAWLIALLGVLSIAGMLPAGLVSVVAFFTSCPVSVATGGPCPLCGTIHALAALLAGDIAASLATNPLALGIAPLGLAQLGYRVLRVRRPKLSWREEAVVLGAGILWLGLVLLRS